MYPRWPYSFLKYKTFFSHLVRKTGNGANTSSPGGDAASSVTGMSVREWVP